MLSQRHNWREMLLAASEERKKWYIHLGAFFFLSPGLESLDLQAAGASA